MNNLIARITKLGLFFAFLALTISLASFIKLAQADFKALSREAQADAAKFQSGITSMEDLKNMEGVNELEKHAAASDELDELKGLAAKCGNAGCSALEEHAAEQVQQDEELKKLHDMAATREKMEFDYTTDPIFNAEHQLMQQDQEQDDVLAQEFKDCTIERKNVGGTFSTQTCMSWAKPEDVSCNKKLEYDCSRQVGADLTLISTHSKMPWSYNKNTGALRLGASGNTFNSSNKELVYYNEYRKFVGSKGITLFGSSKSTFTTKFKIKNLTDVTSFLMTTANFKEYVRITVNGKQVYIGPIDGNKLDNRSGLFRGECVRVDDYCG